jgi:hypothetical protein
MVQICPYSPCRISLINFVAETGRWIGATDSPAWEMTSQNPHRIQKIAGINLPGIQKQDFLEINPR